MARLSRNPLFGRWMLGGAAAALLAGLVLPSEARAGEERAFGAGSLVVPMDLTYQDHGLLQAYGLVFQLLRQGVTVYWVIDPDKVWHAADCDTPGDECAWDCAEEGSGVKCSYPTASPDFYASAEVVWDGAGLLNAGDPIADHGYRGGPFVIDASDVEAARPIVDAWNDPALWTANPWASRTVFHVVTVHETTTAFTGWVRREMAAAPTIAVFSDGNEDIATSYLRAAGIPQSNGLEFPAGKCAAGACGPGTSNPDMLTVESIMGDMGTCESPVTDHKNGALFTPEGAPAYCQIMSMHWNVADREVVRCDGGNCPATQAECAGQTFTYHGHEVVAEVRQFLKYPTHFFAECQAVNAYENTAPNPAWPYLDDAERDGHFLTTLGTPPDCPCTDGDFECVTGGCDGGTRDCCVPRDVKEKGAGFLIAAQPATDDLQILHPEVPYNQMDGTFGTTGGSEPAYNLSTYLGTAYKNAMDVTFITGPSGPGEQDVWMTGYMDGTCAITHDDVQPGQCVFGKVSYLGGHAYTTAIPVTANPRTQGCRLFLNALFEADCVTSLGQPSLGLSITGRESFGVQTLPATERYTIAYYNGGQGMALDASLTVTLPAGTEVADAEAGSSQVGGALTWDIGAIGGLGGQPGDPPRTGSRWIDLRFTSYGTYSLEAVIDYRVGVSLLQTPPATLSIRVAPDADGDGIPDDEDPFPNDAYRCGDSDEDTCDDCSVAGSFDPANDGPDADTDGLCDAGDPDEPDAGPGDGDDPSGCGCGQSGGADQASLFLMLLGLALGLALRRRRLARRMER